MDREPQKLDPISTVAAGCANPPVGTSVPAGPHAEYPVSGDGFVLIPVRRHGAVIGHARVDAQDAYLAREVMGLRSFDGRMVDHVNHDKLDNTRANLRVCTNSQNQQNRKGAASHNRTGLRGVCKGRDGFRACVGTCGKVRYLGTFKTADEAARVAEAARRQLGFLGGEVRPEVSHEHP